MLKKRGLSVLLEKTFCAAILGRIVGVFRPSVYMFG